jgi:hypothetical protein
MESGKKLETSHLNQAWNYFTFNGTVPHMEPIFSMGKSSHPTVHGTGLEEIAATCHEDMEHTNHE